MASYAHAFPRFSDIDAPDWRRQQQHVPAARGTVTTVEIDGDFEEEAPATSRSPGAPHHETIRVGLFRAPEDEAEALDLDDAEPVTVRSDAIEIRAAAPRVLSHSFDPASQVFDEAHPDPMAPMAPAVRRPLESGIVPASMLGEIADAPVAPAHAGVGSRLRGLVSRAAAAVERIVA